MPAQTLETEPLMMFRLYEDGKLTRTACARVPPSVRDQLAVFVEERPHLGYVEHVHYKRHNVVVDGVLTEVQWHRYDPKEPRALEALLHRYEPKITDEET